LWITREQQSAPITSARWLAPVAIYCAAVLRAYMKPAQAEAISIAPQRMPSRSCNTAAVEAMCQSGETVPTTSRSMSAGETPERSKHCWAEW